MKTKTNEIAKEIANELMTSYSYPSRTARRLVMEFDRKLNGPGLSQTVVVERVLKILQKHR